MNLPAYRQRYRRLQRARRLKAEALATLTRSKGATRKRGVR